MKQPGPACQAAAWENPARQCRVPEGKASQARLGRHWFSNAPEICQSPPGERTREPDGAAFWTCQVALAAMQPEGESRKSLSPSALHSPLA
jgi:hypothetical protein